MRNGGSHQEDTRNNCRLIVLRQQRGASKTSPFLLVTVTMMFTFITVFTFFVPFPEIQCIGSGDVLCEARNSRPLYLEVRLGPC